MSQIRKLNSSISTMVESLAIAKVNIGNDDIMLTMHSMYNVESSILALWLRGKF